MADDIRIKDLQSTASYMESDDYLPIDSLALGNRKIPFTGLMDSEDDRLPTTAKSIRGALGEHEEDISDIKSSLSNLTSNDELYKTSSIGDTSEHEFSLNYSALNYLFITIEVSWLSASTFTGILTIPSVVWVKTNSTDTTRIYTNNNPNNSYIEVLTRSSDKIKVKANNANVGLRITGIGKIA